MASVKSNTQGTELHKRLLFPTLPVSTPVPPLLTDASPELNAELYNFIALALRAYVHSWWSKLTRYDRDFLPQITVVLTTVARKVADRLQAADLPSTLLSTLPLLLKQHYADCRQARAKLGSAYAQGGAFPLSTLFHASQAHIGIDAEGRIEPEYVRQIFELILKECLPPEDNDSDCEKIIIREVLTSVVVKDVAPLLSQPWFWHRVMLEQLEKFGGSPRADLDLPAVAEPAPTPFSFNTLAITLLSLVQSLSTICIALIQVYKNAMEAARTVNARAKKEPSIYQSRRYSSDILFCALEMLQAREHMAASFVFYLLEAFLAFAEPLVDRCLVYLIRTHLRTESRALEVVRIAKQTLFPNGYPGPATPVPLLEEQLLLRNRLVHAIESRIPALPGSLILGPTKNARIEVISEALAPLDDPACNAHLVLFLLDAIVLALFPEFAASLENREGVAPPGTGGTLGLGDDSSEHLTPDTDDDRPSKRSSQIAASR